MKKKTQLRNQKRTFFTAVGVNVYYIKNVLKPHGCKTGCPQIVHSVHRNVCAIECTKYNTGKCTLAKYSMNDFFSSFERIGFCNTG